MPDCVSPRTIYENLRSAAATLAREAGKAPEISCVPGPDDLSEPDLGRLYRYWLSLRVEDRGIPHQDRIEPFALRFILGRINIVEPMDAAGSDYRFRLGGTEVAKNYGFELTGQRVAKAFVPTTAAFYQAALRVCHHNSGPLYIVETPHPSVPFRSWHHLMLPFANGAGSTVSRLLWGMVAGPRRLTVASPPPPAWRRR